MNEIVSYDILLWYSKKGQVTNLANFITIYMMANILKDLSFFFFDKKSSRQPILLEEARLKKQQENKN